MSNVSIENVLSNEMRKIAGCDAVAVISLATGMVVAHAGALPDEPIRGMLGGAARDMIAGQNVLMIEDEFAKMKGGPRSSGSEEYAHAINVVLFKVGQRWHFLQRVPGRADLLLALTCPNPNFGMVLAQLPGMAKAVAGAGL